MKGGGAGRRTGAWQGLDGTGFVLPERARQGRFPTCSSPLVTEAEAEVPPTTPAGLAAVAGGPAHERHPVQLRNLAPGRLRFH